MERHCTWQGVLKSQKMLQVCPQHESLLTTSGSPVWIFSLDSSSLLPEMPFNLLLFFFLELFFDLWPLRLEWSKLESPPLL